MSNNKPKTVIVQNPAKHPIVLGTGASARDLVRIDPGQHEMDAAVVEKVRTQLDTLGVRVLQAA